MSHVAYEVIADHSTLPPEVQAKAQEEQGTEGVTVVQEADATYAILSAGEKPSGGYRIDVQQVKLANHMIKVSAPVVEPSRQSFTIQVMSYPQSVVKLAKNDLPVEWVQS
jgi:hypothetical protein